MKIKVSLLGWLVGGLALFSSVPLFATLGGDVSSIQSDASIMGNKTVTTTDRSMYALHEINKNSGHVHEFTGADGKVFALAWRGNKHPDLKTLTGSYFPQVQAAIVQARRNHRHGGAIVVDSGNFHFEMGGRMMSVYGQVWLKDKVPNGMNLHEIQ